MARRDRSSSRPERGGGKPGAGKPGGRPPGGGKPRPDSGPGRPPGRGAPRAGARPGHAQAPPGHEAEPQLERSRLIYGRNPVKEALRGRRRVKRIWATQNAAAEGWGGAKLTIVDAEEIERLSGTDAHQGVCADVEPYPYANASALLAVDQPLIVALDEVTDPQNLGAIVRSAECAGATGVVVPERRAAEVTPAVCKASAGAVEHLPIARVRNLSDFLIEAKEAGSWVYGAAAEGSTSYLQPDYAGGVVLVLGAEGRGLRPRVAKSCDALVSLPLNGRIDSLNVSATAAVLLYAILQRRLDTST